MSNHKKSGVRSQESGVRRRKASYGLLLTACCLLFFSGCRMDMQDQPKYEAYEKGSIRKPVEGTVPRGYLKDDKQFYTGKKDQAGKAGATTTSALQNQSVAQQQQGAGNANMSGAAMYPDVVDTFPFTVTEDIVRRGQERFNIFCAMCHGPTGYGDGMIVRRGYRRPPSYHTDALRQAPVGHFFDVITNGWGAMPSYSAQIPVADRWAIVAYLRALQLSQNPQGTTSSTNTNASAPPPQGAQTPRAETGGRR